MRTACALAQPLVELEDAIVTFDENLAWPMPCRYLAGLGDRVGLVHEEAEQALGADLLHRPATFNSLHEKPATRHVVTSTHPTFRAGARRDENRLMEL